MPTIAASFLNVYKDKDPAKRSIDGGYTEPKDNAHRPDGQKIVTVSATFDKAKVKADLEARCAKGQTPCTDLSVLDQRPNAFIRTKTPKGDYVERLIALAGQHITGARGPQQDVFVTKILGLTSVELNALKAGGVAIGFRYTRGTADQSDDVIVWGQQKGDNFDGFTAPTIDMPAK